MKKHIKLQARLVHQDGKFKVLLKLLSLSHAEVEFGLRDLGNRALEITFNLASGAIERPDISDVPKLRLASFGNLGIEYNALGVLYFPGDTSRKDLMDHEIIVSTEAYKKIKRAIELYNTYDFPEEDVQ